MVVPQIVWLKKSLFDLINRFLPLTIPKLTKPIFSKIIRIVGAYRWQQYLLSGTA
jgi:hypothetical protein